MSFFRNLSTIFAGNEDDQTRSARAQKVQKSKIQHNKKHKQKTQKKSKKQQNHSQTKSTQQVQELSVDTKSILREAQAKAREIIVEAKDEALMIKSKAERKAQELENKLFKQQSFLEKKLDKIDDKLGQIEQKENRLEKTKEQLNEVKTDLDKKKKKLLSQLEKVASMSTQEAKDLLFQGLEKRLTNEMAQFINQKKEEAKQEADDKAREILIEAMKYAATDYVAEYTVSVVDLPSEEVKGKIIGKSGRNIHAFERITGVDVDLDASPTEVKISSFDPIRREIARVSLIKLIKDGRIQPSRIESIVKKVKSEIDKTIFEAGKNLCHEVGVYNIPAGLMKILGRFKYRFSYGQSMIAHTLEETRIGIKLAHELGCDVNVVKLGCLLHDVGKVSDDVEGNHVELGVKLAKRFNMPKSVTDCIAQHHEDEPFTSLESMVVYIADAISGARPGARYENFDEYVERLEKLEEIANSYPEVDNSYAIQAGRELRVILKPKKSKDDDVMVLAGKIRDEVKEKVMVPGSVTVTVIREVRGKEVAK